LPPPFSAAEGRRPILQSRTTLTRLPDGTPKFTALAYLSKFEEVSSVNNTGARSQFLNRVYAEIAAAQRGAACNHLDLGRALHNAHLISADTNDGQNPIFPQTSEASNAARLGYGVSIKAYGAGSASPGSAND